MAETAEAHNDSTNTPLYLQIAHKLERQIVSGERAVGSLLPPEAELAAQLGVSRHTIRQAIAQLRQRGMLAAKKGVGTSIESARPQWRERFRDNNRGDLFEFANETEMYIRLKERREVRGKLATEIGCRPGKPLIYMEGPRHFINEPNAFCWNEVYLDPIAEPVIRDHGCAAVVPVPPGRGPYRRKDRGHPAGNPRRHHRAANLRTAEPARRHDRSQNHPPLSLVRGAADGIRDPDLSG